MTEPTSKKIELEAVIPPEMTGKRLDQIAANLFSEFSRSRIKQWILDGSLLVDQKSHKPKDKMISGATIQVNAALEEEVRWSAQPISLDVVYEDEEVLIINKPEGLVVHPAAGHADGTLVNGLLAHCPDLAALPRAGIVHRLDKDTTGLMVVAKTLTAHNSLVTQLQDREVKREYEAVTVGVMTSGGTVEAAMGRHPKQRQKMAVLDHGGKEAITHYRVIKRYPSHTHVRLQLETGRTHQIRVHMAHIGYPLVGDPTYGGRLKLPKGATPELRDELAGFKRQALHARRLALVHPATGEDCEWEVPLPEDMQHLLETLKQAALEDS